MLVDPGWGLIPEALRGQWILGHRILVARFILMAVFERCVTHIIQVLGFVRASGVDNTGLCCV